MQNFFQSKKQYKRFNYKSGEKFGRLTYTGRTYTLMMYGAWRRFIECVCDCGEVRDFLYQKVACGETQSCGCLRRDSTSKRRKTHGLTNHSLYDVWNKMVERCYKETDKAFKNYGARHIEVWLDWKEDFLCFYEWCIENGWQQGLSLDRINNDGNYAPNNCRFSTTPEQNRNRRNNRFYTAFGETKCLFDWGKDERCVVGVWALRGRMDKPEWQGRFEEALTTKEDRLKQGRTKKNNVYITAFGETKCFTAWLDDPRCVVKLDSLRERYRKGWDGEKILTTPPHSSGMKGVKNTING